MIIKSSRNNHRLIRSRFYMGYEIMQEKVPFIEVHLSRLIETIHLALQQYSKVFAFRLDLRFPYEMQTVSDEEASEVLSRFLRYLKEEIDAELANKRHKSKVRYCWCREVGMKNGRLHYHLIFLLNGNAFRCLGDFTSDKCSLYNLIGYCWAKALRIERWQSDTSIHFCDRGSYWLRRNSDEEVRRLIYRSSYLCKEGTKRFGNRMRNFGASRG